jgi:hypothetical protein
MSVKSALRKLQRSFASKDAAAFDDAMEELEDKVGDEAEKKEPDAIEIHNHIPNNDAAGEGGIEIHNHIPGKDGMGEMPPMDKDEFDTRDDEQPEWLKKFSKDCMDRFKSIDDKFEAMGKKDEPDAEDDIDPELMGAKEDEGNLEMDARRGKDAKDDEANKKILGELEFEAPPGTNDKARKAKDSMYLEDSFQDAVSKAEIRAPGIRIPAFDKSFAPVKTAKVLFALRRTALDLAYSKPDTRGIIDAAMSGHTFDSKKMPDGSVRVLFNAVAAQAARDNNERSTTDSRSSHTANNGQVAGKLTSLASINERNRERFARKAS